MKTKLNPSLIRMQMRVMLISETVSQKMEKRDLPRKRISMKSISQRKNKHSLMHMNNRFKQRCRSFIKLRKVRWNKRDKSNSKPEIGLISGI